MSSRSSDSGSYVGTNLGVFRIDALIGVGGMGEVYRAHDTKLGRDVAIKILAASIVGDAEHRARFEREARMLAALKHPHIATIHGIEESGGVYGLVLELIEGETVADLLAKGPLPVADVLRIARQLVDGLDAAHEKGIVHRDLKPANVAIAANGDVKILDFGIAKAVVLPGTATGDTSRRTEVAAHTEMGTVLGTAPYMSPEQARGLPVDKRTDVWAFGCVCFEMLVAKRAFDGATFSDTIAAVLAHEPAWSLLPSATPPSVRRLLHRCLDKDPRRRLRDIADARSDLDDTAAESSVAAAPRRRRGAEYAGWAAAALLVVGMLAALPSLLHREGVTLPVSRTTIVLPAEQRLATGDRSYPLALSRDGSRLAYVAEIAGIPQLAVREIGELKPTVVPGTAGANHPFFSPDGEWIGFFASGALQKVAVAGGSPIRICNVASGTRGGSWGADGTIVWATQEQNLMRVDAAGGAPQMLDAGVAAAWPALLPDGRTILFTVPSVGFATIPITGGAARIVARLSTAQGDAPTFLGAGGVLAQAQYVSSGHLVFGEGPGIVRAIPFDLAKGAATGAAVSLLESVERARNGGGVYFAVAANGTLVYAATGTRHRLVWVDRSGIETPVVADTADYRRPAISPDGRRILVAANDETRRSDIWLIDVERGTRTRVTRERHNLHPNWTPDGARLTYNSDGAIEELVPGGNVAPATLLSRAASREQRAATLGTAYPDGWSRDGKLLLLQADEDDLWVFSRETGALTPLLVGPSHDFDGAFSPDAKWLAFVSDESGREEVYVARFPDLADRTLVSVGGGRSVRWSRDGRELVYRNGDAVMAMTIDTSAGVRVERPRRLFSGPYFGAGHEGEFDIAPDGRRFVMVLSDEAARMGQLTVVQNWLDDLKSRAPAR
jgi:eukaryotic-like serine/threonine-protein kinase